jgi:hypothetical protein
MPFVLPIRSGCILRRRNVITLARWPHSLQPTSRSRGRGPSQYGPPGGPSPQYVGLVIAPPLIRQMQRIVPQRVEERHGLVGNTPIGQKFYG